MKKRIFSPRLYWDGIKQLRIIGILSTVALCFIGIINPFMQYLNSLNYTIGEYSPSSFNYLEMNFPIVLLFCAIAPLMTLYLFSFLNKRDSCDFYHAIPETRQCVFLSLFAAVITWITFIAVVSATVIPVVYTFFPQLYTVNYSSVVITGFSTLTGAYLVAASVAVAMCVTGTTFSNILVSLLLIFLPRTLIEIAILAISEALPIVSGLSFATILNYEYNVPVGFVFGLLFGDYEKSLTSIGSGIYTLVVSILLTVIALVLFTKRASESAGQSAPNRMLQAVYRFLIGSVLTAVAVFGLFDTIIQGDSLNASMLGTLVILFVVSVLLALVFQVITSHSFRNLPKYALSLVVSLLIFGGVYLGGLYGMYYTTLSYSPAPEEIQSVRILSGTSGRTVEYFKSKTEKMELTDENARRIVSEQLAESVKLLKQSKDRYWYNDLEIIPVEITSGGRKHLRNIRMTKEQLVSVYDTVRQTEEFRKIYTDLPKTVSTIYFSGSGVHSQEELYQVFLQEVEEIGFDKWFALQNDTDDAYIYDYAKYAGAPDKTIGNMTCRLYEGMQWYEIRVPLDVTVLPKTAQEYLRQNIGHQSDKEKAAELLKNAHTSSKHDSLTVAFYNFEGDMPFGSLYIEDTISDLSEDIAAWGATLDSASLPDVTKPFYRVSINHVTQVYEEGGKVYGYDYEDYTAYYQGDNLPDWILNAYREQLETKF